MGTKITDLTALATAPDTLDVIAIVDVSDNIPNPSGTTKKITIADLGFLASGDNISLLNNDSGFITASDYSNSGEAAAGDRDLGNTNAFALSLITNGLGRINIEAGGDVGIGTSTPTAKLDVVGLSALNNIAILANSTTTGVGVDSIGLQGQSIATNGTNHYGVIGKALNGSSVSWGGYFEVESGASVISAFGTTAVEAVNDSTNSNFNYGFNSRVTSTSGTTYGIKATATGAATTNYGAYFSAQNAVNNYALIAEFGNVGIGTGAPTEKLEVVGSIKMNDGNQALGKVITSDANGVGSWDNVVGGIFEASNNGGVVPTTYAVDIQNTLAIRGVTSVPIATFNTSTGLLIGGASPSTYNLSINTVNVNAFVMQRNTVDMLKVTYNAANPTLRMYNSTSGEVVNIAATAFAAYPTYFNSPSNFGIGTATPTDKLQVVGTVDATRYKVGGLAGANFSGAVTNITVVDGIVTAVS